MEWRSRNIKNILQKHLRPLFKTDIWQETKKKKDIIKNATEQIVQTEQYLIQEILDFFGSDIKAPEKVEQIKKKYGLDTWNKVK